MTRTATTPWRRSGCGAQTTQARRAASGSPAPRCVRTVRKPLLLRRRRGPSLALLGPNGVGKSTAAAELQQSVPFDLRIVYMGLWKTPTRPRARPWKLVEIAIRPVRIWWRYLRAQYHQARGRVVVFDRYVYDALLPPAAPLLTAKRMYFFLRSRDTRPTCGGVPRRSGTVAYGRKPENPPTSSSPSDCCTES